MPYFLDFETAQIGQIMAHRLGNKAREEGFLASRQSLELSPDLQESLIQHLQESLDFDACFRFDHEENLDLNAVYTYAKDFFQNRRDLADCSLALLQHLYNCSDHPQVKPGEFYVCPIEEILFEDEICKALALFKAETQTRVLSLQVEADGQVGLETNWGTDLSRLDKACLILDTQSQDGLRIFNLKLKQSEAKYWKDEFLRLSQVLDAAAKTQACLQVCKTYAKNLLDDTEDKQAQISFLNKSLQYFEQEESFDLEQFAQTVFDQEPQRADDFKSYTKDYQSKQGFDKIKPDDEGLEHFFIAPDKVKKAKRSLKTLIQLDTQIEIKLQDGSAEQYLEKAFDEEKQMYYYKVYFKQER